MLQPAELIDFAGSRSCGSVAARYLGRLLREVGSVPRATLKEG
jgi:hypothetical protein